MRKPIVSTCVLASVGLCGLLRANEQSTDATSAAPEASAAVEEQVADVEAAREVARQLQTILAQPLPKLLGAARRLVASVTASLDFDPEIARCRAREQLLQQARIDLLAEAGLAAKDRADLKKTLEEDILRIREQLADDKAGSEREIVALIQLYRPSLVALKEQEESCREQARRTDQKLAAVRRTRLGLEGQRRAAERRGFHEQSASAVRLPDILDDIETGGIIIENAPPTSIDESLDEALRSIEGL